MKLLLVGLLSVFFFLDAWACVGGKGFLPPNNWYIPADAKNLRGIDESSFNETLDKVATVYESEVARFGGRLEIRRKWQDGTVNAIAYREGSTFVIEMFGGLARHSSITKDALTLVACHEIGHHIGGAPRYTGQAGMQWASTEGQSDYFATTKCMRKIFEREDNDAILSGMRVDPVVTRACEQRHREPVQQAICKRISMAGLASASMFSTLQNRPAPKFDTPDPSVVTVTYESHPQYQCRLDTYFNGAICDVSQNEDFSPTNPTQGACNKSAEKDFGFRPFCWFKPAGGTNPGPGPGPGPGPTPTPDGVARTPTVNGQIALSSNNPNQLITLSVDVSNIQGAAGLAVEVSRPNQPFSNPNSTSPDTTNGLFVQVFGQTRGTYRLMPAQQLPGWGRYEIRVIALDRNRQPVSKNSNSFTLTLQR